MHIVTKGAKRRTRQTEAAAREPAFVNVPIVILWVVVIACAAMLVPPLWTVVVNAWQFRSSAQECSTLELAAARRACYEELGIPAPPHPTKVAVAPLHPSGQQGE